MPSNKTPTIFYGPAVPAGVTVYTVPANKIAVIKSFIMQVPDGTDYTKVSVDGSDAEDTVLVRNFTSVTESVTEWAYIPLTEGQTLLAECDGGLTLTITGDLYDV